MSEQLNVIARITPHQEHYSAARDAICGIVERTRAEPGCIEYHMLRDAQDPTLFIFYEVLTLSTYPLVIHAETAEARRAGRTYLGILLGTSIGFLLLGVIWTWTITGTLDFTLGGILEGRASHLVVGILLALYIFGIAKAALMPLTLKTKADSIR